MPVARRNNNSTQTGQHMMKQGFVGMFTLAMIGTLASCMTAGDGADPEGEQQSEIGLSGSFQYDSGTQCVAGGLSIHCCPPGTVMIGAQVNANVFKCGQISGTIGNPFIDLHTQRNNMHACPLGSVMVGLHASRNVLLCQTPAVAPSSEYVDNTSQDGYPMHVCSVFYGMAGIDIGHNKFTCDD